MATPNYTRTMTYIRIVVLLLASYAGAAVQVIQSDDITVIDGYVRPGALVVLDIDDTIIRSKTTLGNPACFYGLREKIGAEYAVTDDELRTYMNEFDRLLQQHVEFSLVDERLRGLVIDYQQRGIPVVALTSRPHVLHEVTRDIIEQLDFPLGLNFPSEARHYYLSAPALYEAGILYVGRNEKAQVLDHFIRDMKGSSNAYDVIIFADDKEMYVRELERHCRANATDYLGLYYTHEKARQRSIDLDLAMEQVKHLIGYSNEAPHEDAQTSLVEDRRFLDLFLPGAIGDEGYYFFKGRVIPDEVLIHQERECAALIENNG